MFKTIYKVLSKVRNPMLRLLGMNYIRILTVVFIGWCIILSRKSSVSVLDGTLVFFVGVFFVFEWYLFIDAKIVKYKRARNKL